MTGWNYKCNYNRVLEQRGLMDGHLPVFDTEPELHKCPKCFSFIYTCQGTICVWGDKENSSPERRLLIKKNNKDVQYHFRTVGIVCVLKLSCIVEVGGCK